MKALGYILLFLFIAFSYTDVMAQKNKSVVGSGTKNVNANSIDTSDPSLDSENNDRKCIRRGNRLFKKDSYAQAEVEYKKALESNPNNPQAAYNLGCALMMQNSDSAAVQEFQSAARMEKVPLRRAQANHNIGVICQNHKMYAEAIEAYKQALRDNPYDDETRYNLALCKKLLKDNPQQKNDNKNKNKDKNGNDKKNSDKENKDKKDPNKDKQKKSDAKKDESDRMSKKNAEQLLNAAMRQERQTKDRMNKMKEQPRKRDLEKNW